MYSSSSLGTSTKPSWAFDVADGSPRSKTTLQHYRIPYPSSPDDEANEGQQFVCARAFLVLVNILFFVIGFAAVVTSIAVTAKPERCEVCHSVLNILLTFGIVSTFISALGIYGALSNSYKILLAYVTFVAFVFMVQMVLFFWPLFGRFNFQRRMHTIYREKMRQHPHQLTELLNLLQRKLPCCGVDGPRDYHSAGLQLPLSCCASTGPGGECAVRVHSTTPPPALNTTEPIGNTTSSVSVATSPSTAPPAEAPVRGELTDEEAAAHQEEIAPPEEEEDSSDVDDKPSDVDDESSDVDDMSSDVDDVIPDVDDISSDVDDAQEDEFEVSTEPEKSSTVDDASTEDQKIPNDTLNVEMEDMSEVAKDTAEKPAVTAQEPPPKTEGIISDEKIQSNAVKPLAEADNLSDEAGYISHEIEPEEADTELSEIDAADPSANIRSKRSANDAGGISPEPSTVTVGPTSVTPGNASMVVFNSTGMLTANISMNATDEATLEELLSNRTELDGGPEPWDIHHVKMRGCYTTLWQVADRQHGLMVAATVGAVALLSLQLVVLCTAHHVARGDFIQQG
ncbi:hypothetical protein FJT64_010808 [Amphibalanus amphitrite]|uniref:Uncharacterized protein n=1 Tax=Amphibalanus amphitrite TaxID=1232801 RepID=A0A6A4VD17_AMPAM|nr:hypothetical protein FJT64_010808 [Amphibalanus amphitrite]